MAFTLPLCSPHVVLLRHGQSGQDFIVAATFGTARNLFFVDLAANDPIRYSNSRSLERDLGWRGLCIEPNPKLLWRLAQRRTCTVVGAVVSDNEGVVVEFEVGKGRGIETDNPFSRILPSGERAQHMDEVLKLTPATLRTILRAHRAPSAISYLSLDVESHEDAVLLPILEVEGTPEFTFHAITIEGPSTRLQAALYRRGYKPSLPRIGHFTDQLWLHNSIPGGLERASARAHAANKYWKTHIRFRSNDGTALAIPKDMKSAA